MEKTKGKVFLVVSITLFLSMGIVFILSGFEPYDVPTIWLPVLLLATIFINLKINIENGRPYYTLGLCLMAGSILIYILIPALI